MLAADSSRDSRCLRQAMTWARETVRSPAESCRPVKDRELRNVDLICPPCFLLVMLASHSDSGGTSASSLNCAGVKVSLLIGTRSDSPPCPSCLNAIMYFIELEVKHRIHIASLGFELSINPYSDGH